MPTCQNCGGFWGNGQHCPCYRRGARSYRTNTSYTDPSTEGCVWIVGIASIVLAIVAIGWYPSLYGALLVIRPNGEYWLTAVSLASAVAAVLVMRRAPWPGLLMIALLFIALSGVGIRINTGNIISLARVPLHEAKARLVRLKRAHASRAMIDAAARDVAAREKALLKAMRMSASRPAQRRR